MTFFVCMCFSINGTTESEVRIGSKETTLNSVMVMLEIQFNYIKQIYLDNFAVDISYKSGEFLEWNIQMIL